MAWLIYMLYLCHAKAYSSMFDSHPGLKFTVVKSLYPLAPPYLAVKYRDLTLSGGGKKSKNVSLIDSTKHLVWFRLDFRCQYHINSTVNIFLRVPSPPPGKNVKTRQLIMPLCSIQRVLVLVD